MTSIPSQDYEQREAQDFQRQIRDAERNPSSRSDCEDFRQQLAVEPALVAERIGWLLDGSYGYGAMLAAKRVLANRRANRLAWLVQTIGAIEWRCRRTSVIAAWKKLSPAEKRALAAAVTRAIKDHEEAIE